MKLKSFKKGVHPYGGKELSKDCEIKSIAAGSVLVYPNTLYNIQIQSEVSKGSH